MASEDLKKNDVVTQIKGISKTKAFLLIFLAYIVKKTLKAGDPIHYIIPNALLFTPFQRATLFFWGLSDPYSRLPEVGEKKHIAELTKDEFSYEALKKATDNFRHPCIVRGLFKGAPALEKWPQKGYLNGLIGDYRLSAIRDATYDNVTATKQDDRVTDTFANFYDEVLDNPNSKTYLFFPVKSRFQVDQGSQPKRDFEEVVNEVVQNDLELSKRLWNGFGFKESHPTFIGSQMILGRGTNGTVDTTGTGWHCAPGNNWFIQVAGSKRWYFMDPKYSAFMLSMRGGTVNMLSGSRKPGLVFNRLPLSYVDVQAGDLLYNPDWYWHTIQNKEGLAIGCPIREFNRSLSWQNNAQFTAIIVINKILLKFGIPTYGIFVPK